MTIFDGFFHYVDFGKILENYSRNNIERKPYFKPTQVGW